MKNWFPLIAAVLFFSPAAEGQQDPTWPVLKHYDSQHVQKIALPIGGIGTGTVSLGGRGNLQDWEIMSRPAKGYNPGPTFEIAPFFAIHSEWAGKKDTRLLEGPVPTYAYEGERGVFSVTNHGMPRFSTSTFDAAYPFGQVHLSGSASPVTVTLKAFNPLVPGNADQSGIPIAILRYVVTNPSKETVRVSICGAMQNFIGENGSEGTALKNVNTYRDQDGLKGIYLSSEGVNPESEQWGTIGLTCAAENVSYRTNWKRQHWGSSVLDFWDDFSQDGKLEDRPVTGENKPMATLAQVQSIPAGESRVFEFYISWHFPNQKAWSASILKKYYTTQYTDAWDVARKVKPGLKELEHQTIRFVNAFCSSDLPDAVKEAALFNVSTLRTQTCFRTDDGYLYAWEGCNNKEGCCFGSCTHVWNYEQATAFLFGDLARKRREIEFDKSTGEDGLMSFRVSLPLDKSKDFARAAADGQMGTIMNLYREWQLSGDSDWLRKLYPNAKKALKFAWIKGGWDANKDGVMEGAQHNTMDVEYFGPNPQMGIWYLGALRATEEMARFMNDNDFADECHQLYEKGRAWIDQNLFNGEYYIHLIQPPKDISEVAPSLLVGMGGSDQFNPDYQLGEGCLVDQLVGQFVAHVCGLGYLVDEKNVKTTLQSIMKYNYRESLKDHYNIFRSYALGDESALLMAAYPKSRPVSPFPYFTEVMTGFEYAAAVGMLYEGQTEAGIRCISNIRNRYDGYKRSPFDEAECGHHYGRAMASWGGILALSGFNYSAVTGQLSLTSKPGHYFWSNGYAYGTFDITESGSTRSVRINMLKGQLTLSSIQLQGFDRYELPAKTIKEGEALDIKM
jgi:non-lysosomal glucosylceramidase